MQQFLNFINNTLLVTIMIVLAGATFILSTNKEFPKTVSIPVINKDIRFRSLVISVAFILAILIIFVYMRTNLFYWMSIALIIAIITTVVFLFMRARTPKA